MAVVAEGDIEIRLSPASAASLSKQLTATLSAAGTPAGAGFGSSFDKSADAAIKKSGDSFKNLEKEAGRQGGEAGKTFGKSFGGALTGVAAFSLIRQGGKFIGDSVKEFAESAKGLAQTNQVLKTTGQVAGVTAKDVDGLANSLSKKAAVDDDVVRSAENVLLTFTSVRNEVGAGNDIFSQATGLALDMSTALGTDLQGSVIQLGKALNDPIKGITALSRVGVSFTEQQKEQIKTLSESGNVLEAQKIVLAELSKEFGGVAEATADADGGVQRAAVSVGELKEAIGGALAPTLAKVTPLATGLAESVAELPASVTGAGLAFFGLIASVAVVLKLKNAITGTLTDLGKLGPAGARAATGLDALGRLGGVVTIAAALDVGINKLFETIEEKRAGQSVSELAGDLAELADGSIDLDGALRQAGAGNSFLDQQIRGLKTGLKQGTLGVLDFGDSTSELSSRLDRVDKALVELVSSGATEAAAADLKLIAERFNIPEENISKVFNDYTAALAKNEAASSVAKVAQKELGGAVGDTGDAVSDTTQEFETLEDAISFLNDTISNGALGQFRSLDDAAIGLASSQRRLSEELKENGASFDLSSEKGLKNREAFGRVIDSVDDYVDALVRTGQVAQTQDSYNAAYIHTLERMRDEALPGVRSQFDQYIALVKQSPTELNFSTANAQANVLTFEQKLAALIGQLTTVNQSAGIFSSGLLPGITGPLLPSLQPGRGPSGRVATGRDVVRAGRPLLVGDGGRTEVFVPTEDGKLYPSEESARRAGVYGSTGYSFGDIIINEVGGNPEATAFATMTAIAESLNL